ncbi:hypothetical protein ACJJTC_012575 [Scirpophaga incertulas]
MLKGHTYCKTTTRYGERWTCSKRVSRKCKAHVICDQDGIILKVNDDHTHDPSKYHQNRDGTYSRVVSRSAITTGSLYAPCRPLPKGSKDLIITFIATRTGRNLAMHKGYTFGKQYSMKLGARWRCTGRDECTRCSCYLVLNDQGNILREAGVHQHKPPYYCRDSKVKMIRTSNGKHLVLLNGYTYCKHYTLKFGARRWQCSMHASKNCYAHVIVNQYGYFIRRNERHTHPPSRFFRNSDGSYLRM